MRVITKNPLKFFWQIYPKSYSSLDTWYRVAKKAEWDSFDDIKRDFGKRVDRVGKFTVFDIGGNKYRLIVAIHYNTQRIYVRYVLTHAEYTHGDWKKG